MVWTFAGLISTPVLRSATIAPGSQESHSRVTISMNSCAISYRVSCGGSAAMPQVCAEDTGHEIGVVGEGREGGHDAEMLRCLRHQSRYHRRFLARDGHAVLQEH